MSTVNESPAFSAFRQNIGRMLHLLELLTESADRTDSELSVFKSLPPADDVEEIERHIRLAKNVRSRMGSFNTQGNLLSEWSCVMLVTYTETYVQDALSYFAGLDPSLMNDSEQVVNYKNVVSASSTAELAEELRMRWADNVIDRRGPTKWVARFKSMGASGLAAFDVRLMEELWGIRHLIIHRAGKVTRDFLSRHPECATAVGDQLVVDWGKLPQYVKSIRTFVETVELFLAHRQTGRSKKMHGRKEAS